MRISHVCISDLHLGAETSLLTALNAQGQPDYQATSCVLTGLLACVRDLVVDGQPDAPRPTLVLAGDVLELALAETHQAAMTFETFLAGAFPKEDDLFQREILYVPGNHDHHLWEATRESQYVTYVESTCLEDEPAESKLAAESHVTDLFAGGSTWPEQRLLNVLAHRRNCGDLHFRTVYPNLGLNKGNRVVLFTHGHYVEPLYSAISELKAILFPGQPPADTVTRLESENFAWVDFFWSTLGRSGVAGNDVQRIYEMLGTDAGEKDLAHRLAEWIVKRYLGHDRLPDRAEVWAVGSVLERIVHHMANLERGDSSAVLGADAKTGLLSYLSGPVRHQLARECDNGAVPEQLTVVFGHTHKPFEDVYAVHGYSRVEAYNTGGWVVDTVAREPMHGGAIVLVDEEGACVSLRMYNEVVDHGSPPAVRAVSLQPSPLLSAVEQRVQAGDAWATFPDLACREVARRAEYLRKRAR